MVTFNLALAALLTFAFVIQPVRRARLERGASDAERNLRHLRLRAIRAYYPSLAEMSFEEIEEQYDVETSFHNIGRHAR